MISDERLKKFLTNARTKAGYAVGQTKLPGFLPGAKTFEPYVEIDGDDEISLVDTYFGHRQSGGMGVVHHNATPIPLIQFHGGEADNVSDEEVKEINGFLKTTLRNEPQARNPFKNAPVWIDNGQYVYIGISTGDIRSLDWVEVIVRTDKVRSTRNLYLHLNNPQAMRDYVQAEARALVFWHQINHQRIA